MEALTARINQVEERTSDVKDQMMENKEAKKKRNNYWAMRREIER